MDSLQALAVCCRSCDAAIDAMEAAKHGREVPLPEEPVLMHVTRGTARIDAAFKQWRATGVWPGQPQRNSSGASQPGAESSPGVLELSSVSLGIAAPVLSKVPGYAHLMRDGWQVRRLGPLPQHFASCTPFTVCVYGLGVECVVTCLLHISSALHRCKKHRACAWARRQRMHHQRSSGATAASVVSECDLLTEESAVTMAVV